MRPAWCASRANGKVAATADPTSRTDAPWSLTQGRQGQAARAVGPSRHPCAVALEDPNSYIVWVPLTPRDLDPRVGDGKAVTLTVRAVRILDHERLLACPGRGGWAMGGQNGALRSLPDALVWPWSTTVVRQRNGVFVVGFSPFAVSNP